LPSAMPAAPDSGIWIVSTAGKTTKYRAIVRRPALTDAIRFAVRITDPIGRTGEALKDIPGGPVDPAPDVTDVAIAKVPFPPPGRVVLSFASRVPLMAPPDGPYKVRVTVFPKGPVFPPPLPSTTEMAVGDVPLMPPSPLALGLFRQAGTGPKINYFVRTLPTAARFIVRITAPDGRFAEQTQVVP
jgi:hypothetical protein